MCASSCGTAVWQSRRGRPILAEFLAAAWSKNIFGILAQAMTERIERVTRNYRERLKRVLALGINIGFHEWAIN